MTKKIPLLFVTLFFFQGVFAQASPSELFFAAYHRMVELIGNNNYKAAESVADTDRELARTFLGDTSLIYGRGFYNLAYIQEHLGKFGEAVLNYQKGLVIIQASAGIKSVDYITTTDHLAALYFRFAHYDEAVNELNLNLTAVGLYYGDGSPEYGKVLDILGCYYANRPMVNDSAGLYYAQSTAILGRSALREKPDYAIALSNFADFDVLRQKITGAKPLYDKAFLIFQKTLGDTSKFTISTAQKLTRSCRADSALTILVNTQRNSNRLDTNFLINLDLLAACCHQEGEDSLSVKLYRECIAQTAILLNPRCSWYVMELIRLGNVYKDIHRYLQALDDYRQADKVLRANFPESNTWYGTVVGNMACVDEQMHNIPAADSLYRLDLKLAQKYLAPGDYSYVTDLGNYGTFLLHQNQFARAAELLQQSLSAMEDKWYEKSFYYVVSENLAHCLDQLGHFRAADNIYDQTIELLEQYHSQACPAYADCYFNRGRLHMDHSDFGPSETYYLKAYALRLVRGDSTQQIADVLNDLGMLYSDKGDITLAREKYCSALAIEKRIDGEISPEYAKTLTNEGGLFEQMGQLTRADSAYDRALTIYRQVPGEPEEDYAFLYSDRGQLDLKLDRDSLAGIYFKKVEQIRRHFQPPNAEYANALNNLAELYAKQSKFDLSDSLLNRSLDITRKIDDGKSTEYALTLNNAAENSVKRSDFKKADSLQRLSVGIVLKTGGPECPEYAIALNNQGMLQIETGNYYKADSLLKAALKIYTKNFGAVSSECGNILNNLIVLKLKLGQIDSAISIADSALKITKQCVGDSSLLYATGINNLGNAYQQEQHYQAAEGCFRQTLAIYQRVPGKQSLPYATALGNLSLVYWSANDNALALGFSDKLLQTFSDIGLTRTAGYATQLTNHAEIEESLNNFSQAEKEMKQALKLRITILYPNHPDDAHSYADLGSLYEQENKFSSADSMYREALKIMELNKQEYVPSFSWLLNDLAMCMEMRRDITGAEKTYNRSLELFKKLDLEDSPAFAVTLGNLGCLLLKEHRVEEAEQQFSLSEKIIFNNFNQNISFLTGEEREQWWESQVLNFDFSLSALAGQSHPAPAALQKIGDQQLLLKSFLLEDDQKRFESARGSADPAVRVLYDNWLSNRRLLSQQSALPRSQRIPQFSELTELVKKQEVEVSQRCAPLQAYQENKNISFRKIGARLKPGEAAIEFVRFHYFHNNSTDSVLYGAFVIRGGDTVPDFKLLFEEKSLQALLAGKDNSSEAFIERLYANNSAGTGKGDSLYRLIWKPLEPLLGQVNTIYLAPAGLLDRIAFKALSDGKTGYLVTRYQVRQFLSVRYMAEAPPAVVQTSPKTDISLFGGIDFYFPKGLPQQSELIMWPPLEGSKDEVTRIDSLFKANHLDTQPLTDSSATKTKFVNLSGTSPAIIHLATHGFFLNEFQPGRTRVYSPSASPLSMVYDPMMRSGLLLTGGGANWKGNLPVINGDNGVLTAYEISNLDLSNTALTVLSACNSAGGDIRGTEGVFGLQRAFKLAGVQKMILSLWKIDDHVTTELMLNFYKAKLNGASTEVAFSQAQSALQKLSPFYWASFVLIE